MKIKNILLVINVFLIIAVLSACGKDTNSIDTVNISNAENNGTVTKIPKSLKKKLSENVVVDAEIDAPEKLPKQMGIYNAKIKELENKEQVLKLLSNNESFKKQPNEEFTDNGGVKRVQETYCSNDNCYLSWSGTQLSYTKDVYFDIQDAFSLTWSGFKSYDNEMKNIYKEKQLEFMTPKEAEKKAREFLSLMGITACNVNIFALDSATLKEQQTITNKQCKEDNLPPSKIRPVRHWSKDDDCYALKFNQDLNGVQVSSQEFGKSVNQISGPIIHVYITKSGFVNVIINNIFDIMDEPIQSKTPLSLNKALDIVKNKYDEVIMKRPITITDIEFSYVPQLKSANEENYILTPAWLFNLAEYSDDIKDSIDKRLIINALTGEQME